MNATVYILFYIKRTKLTNRRAQPIYMYVTIQSRRFEFQHQQIPIHSDKLEHRSKKSEVTMRKPVQ